MPNPFFLSLSDNTGDLLQKQRHRQKSLQLSYCGPGCILEILLQLTDKQVYNLRTWIQLNTQVLGSINLKTHYIRK